MCRRWGSRDSFVILCNAGGKHNQTTRVQCICVYARTYQMTITRYLATHCTHQGGMVGVSNSKPFERHHIRTDADYAIPLELSEGFYKRRSQHRRRRQVQPLAAGEP